MIHDLANRFKIKSKSTGSGDQRRPVLHRTKYTMGFVDAHFEQVMARIGRRYFPRLDGDGRGTRARHQMGGFASRADHAAVTLNDGEVVGGSAPEIGTTNKGRTMLEKMGWTTGTALGAVNNKGITQPIEQIVKRSRTGLG